MEAKFSVFFIPFEKWWAWEVSHPVRQSDGLVPWRA